MIHDLALWLAFLGAVFTIGCWIADDTNLGAGLAAGVKGRPYVPTEEIR